MKLFNLFFSTVNMVKQPSNYFRRSTMLMLALSSGLLHAAEISPSSNLLDDGQAAKSDQKPIVLFVTASYCAYCETLREEVFQFLPDDPRFILREVIKDDAQSKIIDFKGESTSANHIANHYGVSLTPTVLFVDANGEQLSEPLVGVITLDFYNFYFDKNVTESTQMIRQKSLSRVEANTDNQAIN